MNGGAMNRTVPRLAVIALLVTLAACSSAARKSELRSAAQINTELAANYARQGQYELAIEKLNRAISQDSSFAPAHSMLAVIQQTRGDFKAAEKSYRRALALDASDPVLKNNFGVFLCSRGKRDEAQRLFAEATRDTRYPSPAEAWTNAGICWAPVAADKAEQAFREALRVSPDFPDALAQMAKLSYARGDYLRTRAFMQRYEMKSRATPELLAIAARSEAALGDKRAARTWAQRLQQDFPASAEAAAFANWQP